MRLDAAPPLDRLQNRHATEQQDTCRGYDWGRTTISVGAGEQSESIVLWPDLSKPRYKDYVVDEKNVVQPEQRGYQASLCAKRGGEEAYVVFRIDAPRNIIGVTYGGRFYNRGREGHVDLLHSFDGGKTWIGGYSLAETTPPWDVIRLREGR